MLEYFALAMLLISLTGIFYVFIFIHDLPHRMAKKRNHPQADAIHYACWLSLFTLHAMWPLVFTWAVSHKKQPHPTPGTVPPPAADGDLAGRLVALEERLRKLEAKK